MSFLNVMLLGGATALLAPLLIHLLNRSRFQTIDWGAMHLLEAALESNTRQFQWESWLLLLIRCLIPVLLAVALARPVLTHFKQSGADQKKSLVLLLDNSSSMAATTAGETLVERGKQELTRIAERSAGAELSLWTTTTPANDRLDGTTLKLARLRTALESIGPAAGIDLAGEAVQVGLRARSQLAQPNQHIILASDFQAAQWRRVSENESQAVRSQLSAGEFPAQLFLLPLRATPPGKNLSLELIDAPQTARRDQPVQLSARVTNHDNAPVSDVRITFQVAGQDLASRSIALASQASEQVEFACEFAELGWHTISVRVDDQGSVHGDDVYFQVVQITPVPRILIVDDSIAGWSSDKTGAENIPPNQTFAGTSRFLRLALTPFTDSSQNPLQLAWSDSSGLQQELLTAFDAVIVANVHQPTRALFDVLHNYVSAGGGLLVFGHAELNLAQWQVNEESANRLLPMNFGQVHARAAEQPARLAVPSSLSTFQSLFTPSATDTEGIEFTKWLELSAIAGKPAAHVLFKFSHGEPWLVEQQQGRGMVVQCASSCADDGTNLPSQPAYVPLMLSLVERITNHTARLAQLQSGQALALQVVQFNGSLQPQRSQGDSTTGSILSIAVERIAFDTASDSNSENAVPTSVLPVHEGRALFNATEVPGFYSAKLSTGQTEGLTVEPPLFSVNVLGEESQLQPLNDAELRALATRMGATLINSVEDYDRTEKLWREGWELWRWVLAIVLGLLFAELLLGLRGGSRAWRGTA